MFLLRNRAIGLLALAATFATPFAHAIGTAANTTINNTATATYTDPAGTPTTVNSNTSALVVDELLNVTLANNDGGFVPVTTPHTDASQSYTVTNTGNGNEPFELSVAQSAADQFDATAVRIYLESDGTPGFSAGDTLYTFNVNDPVLAPDAARVVYVVGNIPAGRANTDQAALTLRASAVTAGAAGNPAGTTFGGAGDGGTDAVVGNTTASATAGNSYIVSSVTSTLVKAQSVLDPFGGNAAVPGATITYTLTFTLSGSGSITVGKIVDPIPANTTYKPASITLNGAPLTDVGGDDAGRFNVNQIEVDLATPLAAPSTQTVTFQVTIN